MWLKRDHAEGRATSLGDIESLGQHGMMTQMHAIKVANRSRRAAIFGRNSEIAEMPSH